MVYLLLNPQASLALGSMRGEAAIIYLSQTKLGLKRIM